MVKTLKNLCLGKLPLWCSEIHLDVLKKNLTRENCEKLLYHMSCHQQITSRTMFFVTSVLTSKPLKRLELHYSTFVEDFILEKIAENSPSIEHISIVGCKNITDQGIGTLLKKQTKLWYLELQKLPLINGTCLQYLHSLKLETLILNNLLQLQEDYVMDAISNCSRLSVLDLQHSPNISDSSLLAASAILKKNLVVLKISGASKITDQSLEGITMHATNLKKLKLYGCNKLTTDGINTLLKSVHLDEIDLSYTVAYSAGPQAGRFQADEFSPTLRRFISCGVQLPSFVMMDLANRCQLLSTLVLCGVKSIDDTLLNELGKICGNRLTKLDLSYCDQVSDSGLEIVVRRFKTLQSLKFQHFQGTGGPLKQYYEENRRIQAEKMEELCFPACRHFDGHHLEYVLPFFKNLTKLDVSGMKNVGDNFLRIVAVHCKRLQDLCLKACKQVSDEGICDVFRNGSPIEKLILSGNPKLTDRSIFTMASHLANTLSALYISGCTRISPQAVLYLKDECVNGVHVQHIVPNSPPDRVMGKDLDSGQFHPMNGTDADLFYWTPTI